MCQTITKLENAYQGKSEFYASSTIGSQCFEVEKKYKEKANEARIDYRSALTIPDNSDLKVLLFCFSNQKRTKR